ncbi:MAG: monovalent cation/H+ antiporter complex subunit F [Alphaproteobacteria bacterium]|nr:monovalent cation/H+ antiporter complex subunit F [Alphaproteobacteria bacterium]
MIIDTKIILFAGLIVIVLLIMTLLFAFFKAKNIYEKIQIIAPFNNLCAVFIAIYCYYIGKPEYIDLALAYAVLSFIGILGLKKYFEINLKRKE